MGNRSMAGVVSQADCWEGCNKEDAEWGLSRAGGGGSGRGSQAQLSLEGWRGSATSAKWERQRGGGERWEREPRGRDQRTSLLTAACRGR